MKNEDDVTRDEDVAEEMLARRVAAELRKPPIAPMVHPCDRCGTATTRVLYTVDSVCESCEPIRRAASASTFNGGRR